jgi:hypothetical protein
VSKYRKRLNWAKILAAIVFVGGSTAVFIAVWWGMANDKMLGGQVFEFPQLNCRYAIPDEPWQPESGIKQHFKTAVLIMRRSSPDAWLAILVKDYKDRIPQDSEVREEALRRLVGYFSKEHLEWERSGEGILAGLPAQRLLFRGDLANPGEPGSAERGPKMSGECHYLLHQGLAYFFLTWSPAHQFDQAQKEFADLRKRFTLIGDRKDWIGKPATPTFIGHEIRYRFQDADPLWEEWKPATDYDTHADLALVGREPADVTERETQKPPVAASVVVLLLKESHATLAAAIKSARAQMEAQQRMVYPQTVIETVEEPASHPESPLPDGQVVLLRVKNGEKRHRFVELGVIALPAQMLVLQCECAWQTREAWQPRFERLLRTFRLESGPTQ